MPINMIDYIQVSGYLALTTSNSLIKSSLAQTNFSIWIK